LPKAAADKLTALRQRARDAHAAMPKWEAENEATEAKTAHQRRLDALTRPKSAGGHGLNDGADQVVTERRRLERAEAELTRLTSLKDARSARWAAAGQLERSVVDWVMRGGIPANCALEAVEDVPLEELAKKGERLGDAVERHRHRLRELAADLHRGKSSPWPSSAAKAAAKIQFDALADAGAPDVDRAIEHGLPVSLPTTMLSALVVGTDKPATVHHPITDVLGLLCWTLRDTLLAKINHAIDEIADDKHAFTQQQREEAEATISGDAWPSSAPSAV